MAISTLLCRRFPAAAALATSALLLLPASVCAAPAHPVATPREPVPPRPRPAPPQSLLERPGTQVRRMSGAPALPDAVSSMSWLVADARSGEVLAAHDAHRRLPPASTLKSLFALTVLPQLDPTTRHKVTGHDLLGIGEGSSLVGVEPGSSYRVADLWRGVFLRSGNDAVHVLASMVGGQRAAVRQMQAKARALGARDTHVVTPDGYDEQGQVSSAYDLAVFGRAGLANAQFARYCSTGFARFPGKHGSFAIQNTNRLLTGADGVGHYTGLIGVKNGYTTNAGNTLIAAAHRGSRTILVTVMHPEAGGHAVYQEARALLNWGFAAAGQVRPVGSLGALPSDGTAEQHPVHAAGTRTAARPAPLFSIGTLISAGAAALLMAGWAFLALRGRGGGRTS